MTEIAFTVNAESNFYKDYFGAKVEKEKFHQFAKVFFKKHDLADSEKYYLCDSLGLFLNEGQRQRFSKQIKKNTDSKGMTLFKKNSPMQKMWNSDVVSKISLDVMNKCVFWWIGIVQAGTYTLWDYNGNIYGRVTDKNDNKINLPEHFIKIKMSEYYSVIEEMEKD